MKRYQKLALQCLACISFIFSSWHVCAQEYPNRTIKIVVPWPPGGGGDAVVRNISEKLSERLGQSIVVENKPGASGFIGAQQVAIAPPDGYTLLMGFDGSLVVAPHLMKAPFNPLVDFIPVTKLNDATLILAAHPSLPVKNLKELIAYAKTKPDGINFGSTGVGTTPHLAGELLAMQAGIKLVHVPYKGGGQAVTDAVSGQIPLIFTVVPTVSGFVKQGLLNPIAVSSLKRSEVFPEVLTMSESGVPGFNVSSWYGIFAPAKTPKPIIDKLQKEIAYVLTIPEVRDKYLKSAFVPIGNTSQEFSDQIKDDYARWGKVVEQAKIKIE
jgi:tripartite-type tricarboxylate transporter receptor subunit TctC